MTTERELAENYFWFY